MTASNALLLVVDDNPVFGRMAQAMLEGAGYRIALAADGRTAAAIVHTQHPALILLDLVLPDTDGLAWARQLRESVGIDTPPIIAYSGIADEPSRAALVEAGVAAFLPKPVGLQQLIGLVRAHLAVRSPSAYAAPESVARRTVVLADDEPVQRRLLAIQLEQRGFEVIEVGDGQAALARARQEPPAAIVSDVLMPELDGFQLCLAIRQDPRLAAVPVVLTSSAYTEQADQELARRGGAHALALRTPDGTEVAEALLDALNAGARRAHAESAGPPIAAYTERLVRQLERQLATNVELRTQLLGMQGQLSVLEGLVEIVERAGTADKVVDEILNRFLDAAGISKGAIYLWDERGEPVLASAASLPTATGPAGPVADTLTTLLMRARESRHPLIVPEGAAPSPEEAIWLQAWAAQSLLAVPLVVAGQCLGLLIIVLDSPRAAAEWSKAAHGVAAQIGEAVVLARTLGRLRASEALYATTFEQAPTGIAHLSLDGHCLRANTRLCAMLRISPEQCVALDWSDMWWAAEGTAGWTALTASLSNEQDVYYADLRLRPAVGEPV